MKAPDDLCRTEYLLFRRQIRSIRSLARANQERPSEFLRKLVDHALKEHEQRAVDG